MSSDSIALGAFVHQVEEMRKAQNDYFELATGKQAHNQRFALSRQLQKTKAAEQKVDAWLKAYHADMLKWETFAGARKGSEVQAQYRIEENET